VDAHHIAVRVIAWGGAGLFAASLLYFLFSYSVTFGEIVHGESDPAAIAIDALLFTAFALHHSVFARNRVRAFVRAAVSDQLERSVYVWVASLMLIAVCYGWQMVPGVVWRVQKPWSWALVAVQVWAVWLTLRSAAVIDGLELAGLRQVSTPNAQLPTPKAMEFKTTGPYGWVRHPIYLGWILLVFSVGTMTMTRFVFAAISTIYLLIAIPLEEKTIRANAGAYEDYMRRVPWKLMPGVF
jgi:protein-S-isoprenylcysteine O-methyltransferase Ste14